MIAGQGFTGRDEVIIPDKKIKWKMNRSKRTKVPQHHLNYALKQLSLRLKKKIAKHGGYTWESTHEIDGLLAEEMHEYIIEMHKNNLDECVNELIDIAATAIWGIASIEHLKDKGIYFK